MLDEAAKSESTEAQPNPGSPSLRLKGSVLDEAGSPVENATVSWFPSVHSMFTARIKDAEIPTAVSDASGRFELDFSNDTSILNHNMYGMSGTAVVAKPGYSILVKTVPITRLLVTSDLTFRLNVVDKKPISVVDSNAQPLVDVFVLPATVDGILLPVGTVRQLGVRTDDTGRADCQGIQPGRVSHVYLQSESLGLHRVPLTWQGSAAQAQAHPLKKYAGRVSTPEGDPIDFAQIQLTFTTGTGTREFSLTGLWHSEVATDGSFETVLADGTLLIGAQLPADFPYTLDYWKAAQAINHTAGRLEMQLVPAMRVEGKVVDNQSGEGLSGVVVVPSSHECRPSITDRQGRFAYWTAPDSNGSFYPRHPLGSFVYPDVFYRTPQNQPVAGVLTVEPIPMKQSSQAIGRVVDEAGNGVANATIDCEYKVNRFSQVTPLFSDRDGYFQFPGIPPRVAVKLTARAVSMGTKEPVSVRLRDDARPALVAVPLPSVFYTGQIVDSSGKPVAGAQVEVRKATVSEAEAFGGEDRMPANLFESEQFLADGGGRFVTGSTLDWNQDTSLEVNAIGFEPYYGSWRTRTPAESDGDQVSFSTIRLTRAPIGKMVQVEVVDQHDQPVESCRVVFLGTKSGLVKRTVTAPGEFDLHLLDSPQIAAAMADGFLPQFQVLHYLPDQPVRFRLEPVGGSIPERPATAWTHERIRQIAVEVSALVPEPATADSLFRKSNYYPALALTDPNQLISTLKDGGIIGKRYEMLRAFLLELLQIPTQELMRIFPELDQESKAILFLEMAKQTSDVTQRESYLSEAMISIGQLSGSAHVLANARLAAALLELGMEDLARQVLQETFQQHEDLQKLAQQTQRTRAHDPGMARYFAPLYTLIDPAVAFRLIEMGAYENEIDLLKVPAVGVMAATDGPWKEWRSQLGPDKFSLGFISYYADATKFFDCGSALELAASVPDSLGKAGFLMQVARNRPHSKDPNRVSLVRKILPILATGDTYGTFHPSHLAADAAVLMREEDRELAEQAMFEALWHCEKENRITPYNLTCELARLLSRYDSQLAKVLVTPCFDDWSWLFQYDNAITYQMAPPLVALCEIDPPEAVSRMRQLFAEHLDSRPSRQYAIVGSICRMLLEKSQSLGHPDRR